MILHRLDKYRDTGLLLLRIGMGIMFILHGMPKLSGGPEKWEGLGHTMEAVGISFAPTFWGFMAAFSEAVGGLLVLLGLLFRPACILILITMIVAVLHHFNAGDTFQTAMHAMELAILFLSLIFIGPGRYSLDNNIARKRIV